MLFSLPRRTSWGHPISPTEFHKFYVAPSYLSTVHTAPFITQAENEAGALKFAFWARYPAQAQGCTALSPEFLHDSVFLAAKLACVHAILIRRVHLELDATAEFDAEVALMINDDHLSAWLGLPPEEIHRWGTYIPPSWLDFVAGYVPPSSPHPAPVCLDIDESTSRCWGQHDNLSSSGWSLDPDPWQCNAPFAKPDIWSTPTDMPWRGPGVAQRARRRH
ncbi:hypothetical protein DFH07DRAFT_956419 [Mycena maculata]|uniref:Uncharacterized protein n=1 Tax=Mycena maculata TaxID=230809 RepID=A0AAD7NK17_9AGAR|nr:hypothetical protein DFH07DRAFT_956419 [Mycena maculata]